MFVTAPTLDELYRNADAIVRVRVATREVKGVGAVPYVRTFYTATVLRTLKGAVAKGAVVAFSQFTGELELPDKILRAAGHDPLQVGKSYIVFLKRTADEWGGHVLVGDVQGVFGIRAGRIEPKGKDHVSLEQRDVSESDFIDEIDRVARREKPKAQRGAT
jgi:hypothetical protein